MVNPFLYAIPVFFVMILLELGVSRLMKRDVYRLNDSINDISTGMLQLLAGIFFRVIIIGGYIWVYEQSKEWGIGYEISQSNVWAWVALFFGVDFFYYWFHRSSHQMNAPWAAHVVHHQSEEYNLSVALRQSSFQGLFSWFFYLPLALVGFPPIMTFAIKAANTLYQFWIHTRLINRLGPFEWVFNTPSHHRVHHARNRKYLDKNHAGTLIIWDRLFGTFMVEAEEPTYGVTKALNSWNPIWANFHTWQHLYALFRRAPRWQDKIKIWFMPPAWMPEGLGPLDERGDADQERFDPSAPFGLQLYILFQFSLTVVILMGFLAVYKDWSELWIVGTTIWIALSLVLFGGLFEGQRWAPLSEFLRLLGTAVVLSVFAPSVYWMVGFIVWGGLFIACWLTLLAECRMHFLRKMETLPLDEAVAEFKVWSSHKEGRSKFPVKKGDSASAIFAQRWGAPK
jgi:alkylglycerol monooxygenase